MPETVCGRVILVAVSDLKDASHAPRGHAIHAVAGLHATAHTRRVQRLEDTGEAEPCSLPALLGRARGPAIDPDRVALHGARVEPKSAVRRRRVGHLPS